MTLNELINEMEETRRAMVGELDELNGRRDQLRDDIIRLTSLIGDAKRSIEENNNA